MLNGLSMTTDRVRAIVTLFVTLAALLAMPTAGGFAGLSDNGSGAFDSGTCSGSASEAKVQQ